MILEETLEKIKKPSQEAMERCRQHWDSIAKPLHSLGKLEDALVRIAGMTGNEKDPIWNKKRALVVMCADNGVVEEGVTQSGQEVTRSFQKICCLARQLPALCADRSERISSRSISESQETLLFEMKSGIWHEKYGKKGRR